jgi:hypothetical protein
MTTNPRCRQFLDGFFAFASEAGLQPSEPKGTNNSVRFPVIGAASHVGVSVISDCLRVNLNNDMDDDRAVLNRLSADRASFESAVGEALEWENPDPTRSRSVVRATRSGGYMSEAADWTDQYAWAVGVVSAFERECQARI